jgi:hypothetical protein
MSDSHRRVLSEPYRDKYDATLARLDKAGICHACARKLALAHVLGEAVKTAEMQSIVDLQLAEHGVVIIEDRGGSPCFR